MTFGFAALFWGAVSKIWPEGATVMDKLTAFDGLRQSREYMEVMVLELRCGTALPDAVTAFCRDVVALGIGNAS